MTEEADVQDDVSGADLTPIERKAIRRLLRQDDRARWLWSTARVWSMWITAVVGGCYVLLQVIREGGRSLLGIDK